MCQNSPSRERKDTCVSKKHSQGGVEKLRPYADLSNSFPCNELRKLSIIGTVYAYCIVKIKSTFGGVI